MKSFVCIVLIVALSVCQAAVTSRHGQHDGVEGVEGVHQTVKDTAAEADAEVHTDVVRFRKSAKSNYGGGAYGGSFGGSGAGYGPSMTYSYPSPVPTVPCGRNLLFSCQPNVAPVPCVAPAPGTAPAGSYAGAYSEHVPVYAVPHFNGHYQPHYRHY